MREELKTPTTSREDLYLEYIKTLEKELKKDSLTSLMNQKAFLNEDKDKGVYLFIDIDNVKILNDEFQDHQLGTAAIRAVGHVISEYFEDDACRYGGDEFLLFIPNRSVQHGEFVGNSLLRQINDTKIDSFYRGKNPIPNWALTCSIGVGLTIEEADKALYQAKLERNVCKGTNND